MADAWTSRHGTVETAVPIEYPRGTVRGWFVPVIYGDRIAGFFQFGADMTPLSYSGFSRNPQDTSTVLTARAWLDKEFIRSVARGALRPGETAGEPFMSYDAVPAKVAWAVPLVAPDGVERIVFVAGDIWFEGRGDTQSTGG